MKVAVKYGAETITDLSDVSCAVKDDFIRNRTYRCGSCVSNNANQCHHTTVEYGPCMSNEDFRKGGCKYRTFLKDYRAVSGQERKKYSSLIDILYTIDK